MASAEKMIGDYAKVVTRLVGKYRFPMHVGPISGKRDGVRVTFEGPRGETVKGEGASFPVALKHALAELHALIEDDLDWEERAPDIYADVVASIGDVL